MQHTQQIKAGQRPDGGYDYSACFQYMKPEIERADVAIANFETTLAGPPYTGYPQFCSPDRFLQDCRDAGFDIMLTANNHVCDRYKAGIERTIQVMDSLGVPHLGSYVNQQQRDQNPFGEKRVPHCTAQLHLCHQRYPRAQAQCGELYR